MWLRCGAAGLADPRLSALTAQLLETSVDHREIVGNSGASAFATQLFDASADHGKIVG